MVNSSARPVFGAALRALRLHVGLSLNELARRAAIDPAYVHRIETRPADQPTIPRRAVVVRLGQALGLNSVQLDDLLSRAGYTPEALVALGGWDETLADVARVLGEPRLALAARAEFREVVHILARRWLADA